MSSGSLDGGNTCACLLVMAGMLAASYAVAVLLPGVRAERSLWPSKVNPNAVLIQQAGYSGSMPTVTPDEFRAWNERRQKYFDSLAYYRVAQEQESASAVLLTEPPRCFHLVRGSFQREFI